MCGICGIYNVNITEEKFKKCVNTLEHRGPDDFGIYMDEICGLGHRRLSILDLSEAGRQPMVSADNRYYIILNGEIYNYIELKETLLTKGYCFSSGTDTEVALYSFIEWGEECQNKFNGMWALIIYDRLNKSLFVSRDRFGVKPLYYAKIGMGWGFASEMKALIPMMKKVSVNTDILMDKNRHMGYESGECCLINEISRLPAGHSMNVDANGIKVKRWWSTLEHLVTAPHDYREQTELYRDMFVDACRIRMRSDVTLGTALSGGLDSSATICTMAHIAKTIQGNDINKSFQNAFVASLDGSVLDETRYAREVTDYLDIPLTEVKIDPIRAIDEMPEYLYKFEEVYRTSPVPMMQTYASMKKNGVTVTLDGHGADEQFAGYPGDQLYALLDTHGNRAERDAIMDLYYGCIKGDVSISDKEKRRRMFDFELRHYAKKMLGVPTWDRLLDKDIKAEFMKMGHLERTLYNSTHMTILPTLLRNYDRYSMASGIEIRMPFMDYRLVTFAFSIDWKSKMNGGYSKSIVRDALRDIMPPSIVNRKSKIGFSTPYNEWARGPWKEWLQDEVSSKEFSECSFINAEKVRKDVLNMTTSENTSFDLSERIWMDISPYFWEKYFLKRTMGI